LVVVFLALTFFSGLAALISLAFVALFSNLLTLPAISNFFDLL